MKYNFLYLIILLFSFSAYSGNNDQNALVEIEVSSPPPKYGDTVDLGTFAAGEEWHAGCLIWNRGDSYLVFDKTVSSDPRFKCDVRLHEVRPGMGVGVIGAVKFDKPVGNFKIKTEIYWKNIKNPTVVYFIGKCVKNTN
ncbi:MAG: hypothetical protein K2J65_01155 [Duncaniella sp.]|nr:hypothetical protein [Duncaniella sp.]